MFKLYSTLRKDLLLLLRDKVGITFIFIMPVILVLIITSIQNSAFDIVNSNKVPVLIYNQDKGEAANQFLDALEKIGLFDLRILQDSILPADLAARMHKEDALLAIAIPKGFSDRLAKRASVTANKAFQILEMPDNNLNQTLPIDTVILYYHPVLQANYRLNIQNGLHSAMKMVETKQILKVVYQSLNEGTTEQNVDEDIFKSGIDVVEVPVSRGGMKSIPNASQHNIPAWTIFAMFFIVISLGSSLVKEKLSGSHLRLKTLPTNYLLSLVSKLILYTGVCLAQVLLIFSLGVYLFPHIGLPALNLPQDIFGLFLVSLVSALCAVSYALCIGVYARTQEQANGFGAVSIVILAAIGGILVPAFAMPEAFRPFMAISPLHWSLESYYGLFLEGGKLSDVWGNLLPLLAITFILQILAFAGLKKNNLI